MTRANAASAAGAGRAPDVEGDDGAHDVLDADVAACRAVVMGHTIGQRRERDPGKPCELPERPSRRPAQAVDDHPPGRRAAGAAAGAAR